MSKYLNRDRFNGAPTPEEMEQDQRRRNLWLQYIGREPPEWEPEANAPKITDDLRAKLRALVYGELPEEETRLVRRLVYRFRTVWDCWHQISLQKYHEEMERESLESN